MNVNPFAVGAGVAVATGLVTGFGGSKLMDSIADKHPTGSDADKPAGHVVGWTEGLGFATAAGGMVALATGRLALGGALFGAGMGAMIGGFGASIAYGVRHGIGVDTSVDNVLSGYDHNRNGQLELEDPGFWHQAETRRTERTSHEDSNGDTYWETETFSIDRLVDRADTNGDWVATRPELRDVVSSYDSDGDGRLKGEELKRFQREVGEERIDWYRSSF
ncbi:MAG: hypothetical protein KDC46_12080 [Thermoleophilia bacterium]|nr:hypothetical protein [Thermoleophilia bacterium]